MTLALVDCNNFYCSCERVFQPTLEGKPLVVLSNNDGCVIARSNEVKAMGIPMGAPYFKYKDFFRREGVVVRSSNYALYGDMSSRVMTVLSKFTPRTEIYSIDECFLDLSGFPQCNLTGYAHDIRETVRKWTGIPVSVGIGKTKTIAKLANRIAKKSEAADGVHLIDNPAVLEAALAQTEIEDVWGIGYRWAKMLKSKGIYTASDFAQSQDGWIRKQMGVVGLRTALELRGTPCIALEDHVSDKQTICVSRSFGTPLTSSENLHDAVTTFASTAAEKLRKGHLVAGALNVFIRTSPFREDLPQYANSATIALLSSTSHTRDILKPALRALQQIYRDGYHYKKAGILLLDLVPETRAPKTLFDIPNPKDGELMRSFDAINKRFGTGTINYGQIKHPRAWYATWNNCSPRFTTDWNELPVAKAGLLPFS